MLSSCNYTFKLNIYSCLKSDDWEAALLSILCWHRLIKGSGYTGTVVLLKMKLSEIECGKSEATGSQACVRAFIGDDISRGAIIMVRARSQ